MKMRLTHICIALLLFPSILIGTAKAEDWNLESYYYFYSGSTTEDFPAPYLGAPECWTVIYDDLDIRATTTWGQQVHEATRLEMRVEENGSPGMYFVIVAIAGTYVVPSTSSFVDLGVHYQLLDNLTGAATYGVLFFEEPLFPITNVEGDPSSGMFLLESAFNFHTTIPPSLGNDVTLRLSFFVTAVGEIFPRTEVTVTGIHVTPTSGSLCCNPLFGDTNFDGRLTVEDIPNFVSELIGELPSGEWIASIDMNHDHIIDGLDIQAFIDALFNDCMGG